MRGNDKLRSILRHGVDVLEKRQLSRGRERRLGLVHQVKARFIVCQKFEIPLSVRVGMIIVAIIPLHGRRCHVKEGFGSEKVAEFGATKALDQDDGIAQGRDIVVGAKVVISRTALGIVAKRDRDRLEQGGLSAAVLANQKGDVLFKFHFRNAFDGRNLVDVRILRNRLPVNSQAL